MGGSVDEGATSFSGEIRRSEVLEMYPKPRADLEERARSYSQGAIAFLNDHEATIVVTEIATVQNAAGITKKVRGKENK